MLRSGRGPTTALLTPLRRACSTNAGLRAEIVALKAQITSLGSVPAAPKAEQSFFAGAASEYTTKLKFFQPHLDGALRPLALTPTPTLDREREPPPAHRHAYKVALLPADQRHGLGLSGC
jgi:hypothetical protein